jgi:hypothetical protein
MREAGFDYFENSRRATYANRAYCSANPMGWRGYSDRIWGLTACDGPGNFQLRYKGEIRQFYGYAARGPTSEADGRDDGTIAPTAPLGSLPFAPEIVIPCAEAMLQQHGARIFTDYGFRDSFNPTFTYKRVKLETAPLIRRRLGSERYLWDRPGADPAAGRELSRRIHLAIHAACRRSARFEARGIHRRLAWLAYWNGAA